MFKSQGFCGKILMMSKLSFPLIFLSILTKETLGEFLYWPIWWYSFGAWRFIIGRWRSFLAFEARSGLTVWVMNWLKPMYGQRDWRGKVISIVMRTLTIGWKVLTIVVYFLGQLILVALWLGLPLLAAQQLVKFLF